LLFDNEYADLFFKWEDGTKLAAHKNIVFKRAAYFKTFASFEEKKLKEPEEKKRKLETDCSCHTVLPMKEYSPDEIRLVLKYIYTGKIIDKWVMSEHQVSSGSMTGTPGATDIEISRTTGKFCCLEKKKFLDTKDTNFCWQMPPSIDGCTFICGALKQPEAKVNCIFTDFSKFQRLVELSALIESVTMTECLFKHWCLSDRYNAEVDCSNTRDLNLKCQYYTNMYKLAINLCDKQKDEGSMKWKAKNQIEKYLIRHSKEITSTEYWKTAVESGEIDAKLLNELISVLSGHIPNSPEIPHPGHSTGSRSKKRSHKKNRNH